MVSAILVIRKRQLQHTYVVKAEDWLNPDLYYIDAQDPYTAESAVVYKPAYKIGWLINENGEPNYSF